MKTRFQNQNQVRTDKAIKISKDQNIKMRSNQNQGNKKKKNHKVNKNKSHPHWAQLLNLTSSLKFRLNRNKTLITKNKSTLSSISKNGHKWESLKYKKKQMKDNKKSKNSLLKSSVQLKNLRSDQQINIFKSSDLSYTCIIHNFFFF